MNRYISVAVALGFAAGSLSACGLKDVNSIQFTAQNSASSFSGASVKCKHGQSGSIRVVLDALQDSERPSLIEIAYADDVVDVYADRSGLVVEALGVPASKRGEEIVFDAPTTFTDGRSGQVKGSVRCVGFG